MVYGELTVEKGKHLLGYSFGCLTMPDLLPFLGEKNLCGVLNVMLRSSRWLLFAISVAFA